MEPEAKDELIKIFISGDKEPKSLVDIDHSLIKACEGRQFQFFRLYVVYEADDRDEIVENLRGEVKDWDAA